MRWECGECGALIERHRPAVVCPTCGTAATPFVPAEDTDYRELGNMRNYWIQMGVERFSPLRFAQY